VYPAARHPLGLAVVKRRLLRALYAAGVPLSEIAPATLIYPEDGPTGPYYHRHAYPVIPAWWSADQLAPLLEGASRATSWGGVRRRRSHKV
jgi:predicted DNA-binding transcriptional regulator YafY